MRNPCSDRFVWFLAAVVLFAVFFELDRMDVVTDNEGQRATPPAEMLRSGDFVIPTINGKTYLSKPPLLYWTIACVYRITGEVSPLTARIPTALCFAALVLSVYFVGRKAVGIHAAQWASLAMAAAPYALERARWANLDVPLALATFWAICGLKTACATESLRRACASSAGAGIALGCALMLKGPAPLIFLWAAWIACQTVTSGRADAVVRTGVRWSVAAFLLELALKGLAYAVPDARWLGAPVALVFVALLWTALAWRNGNGRRGRQVAVMLIAVGVGIAAASPWMIAVVMRMGWPNIRQLVHDEVFQRTYTATRINSGPPFYYLVALPVLLAPWGLLLPLHFSSRQWWGRPAFYRFSVLTGWLSVLCFSLIAGKEYEYVLPAFPFLLMATGCHLAEMPDATIEPWAARLSSIWVRLMPPFLGLLAFGGGVYVSLVEEPHRLLLTETWALVAVALGLGVYVHGRPTRRVFCISGMALCVILIGLVSRGYHYTGDRSFKDVATVTGALARQGYGVGAVKMTAAFDVFPAFAFYAGTTVPVITDIEQLRRRLAGDAPYYCAMRQEVLEQMSPPLSEEYTRQLLGPYTRKRAVLLGNRPLPEGVFP